MRRRASAFRGWFALALGFAGCLAGRGEHMEVASFGTSAGLANLNATSLLEDHGGMVWVGTESGVYVADGERFQKQVAFTEAGLEQIDALREDRQGRIWAMDKRHLVFWDGTAIHAIDALNLRGTSGEEARDLIALPEEPDTVFLLAGGQVTRIASPNGGRSWTASPAVRPEVLADHPELRRLTSLAAGDGSTLWAGCGTMLCRVDVSKGTVETFGAARGVPADIWSAALRSRDGAVWARAAKRVIRLRLGSARFEPVNGLPANIHLDVLSPAIAEDAQGRIVLNAGEGIVRAETSDGGGAWRAHGHAGGFPEAELQALLFDRTGELWMAVQGRGVARTRGYGAWEGWTKAEGLRSNVIWGAARGADGTVWTITGEGMDRLDRVSGRFVPAPTDLAMPGLRVAAADARGHLWLGDANGRVLDYDPSTARTRVAATGLGRVVELLIDRERRVWVCSSAGLQFFSAEDGWAAPRGFSKDALPPGYAWSLAEGPSGALWLSNRQGLFRLDGARWTPIALPFAGGKEYNFMVAAAADGTLWAQSKQPFPMLRLRVQGDRAEIVERVPGADFGSDNITFVHADRRGWLWVGSDDGVHVFNGARWVLANTEDGLLWDDTDFHAFFEDGDGSVWIGTSGGLSHLTRPERLFAAPPPTVRLREARVGETSLSGNDPSLDVRRPTLSVNLRNTNYSRGSGVVFRYRLEGQENAWQDAPDDRLRFPALDAGHYRLTVMAYDTRLHEGSEEVSLPFTVLEPWWRRLWFRWVEAFGGLLLGFAVWRASVHLLVKRQQGLERLIASRTKELEREKAELLSTRSALLEMTRRDSLTGLLNRATIFERMSALCEESFATGRPLAVAMADLDSFKRINDRHGHVMGDTVLRECSRRIEGALRAGDAVGRYGGEELLILMPGLYPASAAARMEQLRAAIADTPVRQGETSLTVTCSFGVAWLWGERCSLESLVELADAALYRAKQNGRNRVEFASSTNGETEGEAGGERSAARDADAVVCR